MPNKPPLIGITGGIGSGKSTVCKIIESLGHKVYYADDRGKWLMSNDPHLKEQIKSLFGEESYVDGELNRKHIADIVFKSSESIKQLNALIHPAVAEDLKKWLHENNHERLLFDEAALLFETGSYRRMDKVILVTAPEETRIRRVVSRDAHRDEKDVQEIMSQQMKDEEKIPLADYIFVNDGRQSLIKQVMDLLAQLN